MLCFTSKVSLTAFVRGIVRSLCRAQEGIVAERQASLDSHMEKQPDGSLKPKTIKVHLDENRTLDVPTFSLSQTNAIGIDAAIIECSAKIVKVEKDEMKGEITTGNEVAMFEVVPSGEDCNKNFKIKMRFKQKDNPESEELILEHLNESIKPIDAITQKDYKNKMSKNKKTNYNHS